MLLELECIILLIYTSCDLIYTSSTDQRPSSPARGATGERDLRTAGGRERQAGGAPTSCLLLANTSALRRLLLAKILEARVRSASTA
jgi:hypothetical protein